MSSVNVMRHYLQRLPFLVKTGSLIEDMLGEKLFQEIEKLIAQHFNCSVQNMTWEVIRWDVSENFEYKEIWFFPHQWLAVDEADLANELQTETSYAYFKLTIKNDVKQEQYLHEGSFVKNTNRFPMINFFQHDYGFVCIQFHINWKVLKKKLRTPEQRYVELKNWHKFVLDVLTEYPMLNDLGFQTGESYCYLKIAQLDIETVAEKFEQGMLQDALEPIGDALHTVSKAFSVFEQIQQQARCYIEKVISKPEEKQC